MTGNFLLHQTREEAALFNPAFIGLLTRQMAAGYQQAHLQGLHPALPFIGVPIVLHKTTRESLPRDLRTTMANWLHQSPERRLGFDQRARAMAPHIRQGMRFALRNGVIAAREGAYVSLPLAEESPQGIIVTDELRACLTRALFVGRWFGAVGTPHTIFALWGVRP